MFGAYGSTYLTLRERDRDLTILRAVGFDSLHIRIILSIRTLFQVLLSFLFGWAIAWVAIRIFESTSPIMVHSIPLPVAISLKSMVIGFLLCVLFALLGVLLPTRHLRKTSVASMISR
jgi:ABC-type antimicrobial peptide transport system permease subunit